MAATATEQPALMDGYRVEARDGVTLGTLSELTDSHFRVDASGARDYWLSRSLVRSTEPGLVCLVFDSDQLDDFKTSSPEVLSESPILDAQADTFESEEERAARREANIRGYEADDKAPLQSPTGSGYEVRDEEVFENEPAYRQPGTGGTVAPD